MKYISMLRDRAADEMALGDAMNGHGDILGAKVCYESAYRLYVQADQLEENVDQFCELFVTVQQWYCNALTCINLPPAVLEAFSLKYDLNERAFTLLNKYQHNPWAMGRIAAYMVNLHNKSLSGYYVDMDKHGNITHVYTDTKEENT